MKVFIVYAEIPDTYADVSSYENKAAFDNKEKAEIFVNKLISYGYRKYSVGIEEMEVE